MKYRFSGDKWQYFQGIKNDELPKVPLKMRIPQKKHNISFFGG
jgi:hypothetical protein